MKTATPVNSQQCQNCDEIALVKIQVTHGAIMLCAACAAEMRTLLASAANRDTPNGEAPTLTGEPDEVAK